MKSLCPLLPLTTTLLIIVESAFRDISDTLLSLHPLPPFAYSDTMWAYRLSIRTISFLRKWECVCMCVFVHEEIEALKSESPKRYVHSFIHSTINCVLSANYLPATFLDTKNLEANETNNFPQEACILVGRGQKIKL